MSFRLTEFSIIWLYLELNLEILNFREVATLFLNVFLFSLIVKNWQDGSVFLLNIFKSKIIQSFLELICIMVPLGVLRIFKEVTMMLISEFG